MSDPTLDFASLRAAAAPVALAAPTLSALPGIRHAFFTRLGGVSGGLYASLNGGRGSADDPAHVSENRRRMAAHLGLPAGRFVGVHQIHSPDCVAIDGPPETPPRADALATATPGLALAVGSADCGPILFADAQARVIGAAHAGWRGAFTGVLEATVARMEELGAARARIRTAIGPMLSQTNYEVGPEFEARFREADPANARFFRPGTRPGHPHFDLPAYIAARLRAAGVGAVEDLALCTYADEARFFSYRRSVHRGEADYGRLFAAIALA